MVGRESKKKKGGTGSRKEKRSGSSCWKNEWGFVLLAGQGEENGGNGVERKTKKRGGPVLLARKKWGRAGGLEKMR